MEHIKITIVKLEKVLVSQITYMDERFRRKGPEDKPKIFSSGNGIYVKSYFCHEYEHNIIDNLSFFYLRGYERDRDFTVAFLSFGSNEERDQNFDLIVEALKDWDQNWEGWKTEKKEENTEISKVKIFEL